MGKYGRVCGKIFWRILEEMPGKSWTNLKKSGARFLKNIAVFDVGQRLWSFSTNPWKHSWSNVYKSSFRNFEQISHNPWKNFSKEFHHVFFRVFFPKNIPEIPSQIHLKSPQSINPRLYQEFLNYVNSSRIPPGNHIEKLNRNAFLN